MQQNTQDLQKVYKRAVSLHETGDFARAVELYAQILAQFPDADIVLYNHGLACYNLGWFADAAESFKGAAELNPDDPDIWFNLGLAYKQSGRFTDAKQSYSRALELRPADQDVLYNLACCLKDGGDADQAISTYERLLGQDPEHGSAVNNLAYLYHLQGRYKQAEKLYRRLLTIRPDHLSARHMLAALSGKGDAAPPREYVRELFDGYSDGFEQSLVEKLDYRVPALLKNLIDRFEGKKTVYDQVVDLGCGTGLAGEAFKPVCRFLVGVDLSPNMVEVAEKKQVYDELTTGDVVEFLQNSSKGYDLILAADVITYLGELEALFQAAAENSSHDAIFCFSTEHLDQGGWLLRPTGRYAHSPEYVDTVAGKTGWWILCSEKANLRKEREEWIQGDLYLMSKKMNS
ncbi:MAG: tetratricopeptide repeat protein [Desulfobulbaceae bacterium]|nr:tetratricopeptide repeat protein [Desulfobulbaceae bacterium]